jgi:hypothetical protein
MLTQNVTKTAKSGHARKRYGVCEVLVVLPNLSATENFISMLDKLCIRKCTEYKDLKTIVLLNTGVINVAPKSYLLKQHFAECISDLPNSYLGCAATIVTF